MPGSSMGNRHSSSRPPAVRQRRPTPATRARRLRDGLDDARGRLGRWRHDLPQERRPRVFRQLVGGIGSHDGRARAGTARARGRRSALGIEASARHVHRACQPPTGGARRRTPGHAERTPAPTPRRPRRSAAEIGNQIDGRLGGAQRADDGAHDEEMERAVEERERGRLPAPSSAAPRARRSRRST